MTYQKPSIRLIGSFEDLTKCMGSGIHRDLLGCGYAWVVVW